MTHELAKKLREHAEWQKKLAEEQGSPVLRDGYLGQSNLFSSAADELDRLSAPVLPGEIERVNTAVSFIETPMMYGDCLAVFLCSHFDNPDQAGEEDENSWTPDAVAGCNEVIAAIKENYAPVFRALEAKTRECGYLKELLGQAAQLWRLCDSEEEAKERIPFIRLIDASLSKEPTT